MTDWQQHRDRLAGALSATECSVLATYASQATGERALEVGHYTGLSSIVLLTSLPADVEFVTVDHHLGDPWAPATSPDTYRRTVAPYVQGRKFAQVDADMFDALPMLAGGFGFVFYDADHRADPVRRFWELCEPLCNEQCILTFDDADWEEQSTLIGLAAADGFRSVRNRGFYRGELDKKSPDTYSLEVMIRG
jgi:predicted O-methyltransferase YrrM